MKVRMKNFKSRAGRCVAVLAPDIVDATFVCTQSDGSTVVILNEATKSFPAGYKIAVWSNDIVEK